MKRLAILGLVAAATTALPVQAAPPSAAGVLVQEFHVGGYSPLPTGARSFGLTIRREVQPTATATPPSLFPIVIDPNNLPALPVAASPEKVTAWGYINECEWWTGCSTLTFNGGTAPAGAVTFEDVPMVGNAISVNFSGLASGSLGSFPVAVNMRFSRPTATAIDMTVPAVQANPWIDGPQAHADAFFHKNLLWRSQYQEAQGTLTTLSDSAPPQSAWGQGGMWFVANASADAPA